MQEHELLTGLFLDHVKIRERTSSEEWQDWTLQALILRGTKESLKTGSTSENNGDHQPFFTFYGLVVKNSQAGWAVGGKLMQRVG